MSTIPMAALVAVMIIVAIGAFDWHSVAPSTLKRMPNSETFVMVATVLLALLTHNLAVGVLGGGWSRRCCSSAGSRTSCRCRGPSPRTGIPSRMP